MGALIVAKVKTFFSCCIESRIFNDGMGRAGGPPHLSHWVALVQIEGRVQWELI